MLTQKARLTVLHTGFLSSGTLDVWSVNPNNPGPLASVRQQQKEAVKTHSRTTEEEQLCHVTLSVRLRLCRQSAVTPEGSALWTQCKKTVRNCPP